MSQQQKIKTVLDDAKFKLTAKPIAPGDRPPEFKLGTYINNPQFTVFPNHDNGSGSVVINAGMDIGTFTFVLELLLLLANGDSGEVKHVIDNKRDIPKEKRTDPKVTKQVVSKTIIGRDNDGRIWISVTDEVKQNAPKVRFYFGLNYYHAIRSTPQMTPGEYSRIRTLAWVRDAHTFMAGILLNNPNAEIDRAAAIAKFGGNSGGGGYQKKNNYGGGGNRGGNSYGGGNRNNNSGGGGYQDNGDDGSDFGGNYEDD